MSSEAGRIPEIEMFSGPGCAYCASTRALLRSHGLEWVEYDTSQPDHLTEFLERLPRTRALPQLFIDGEHIGSWEDLVSMDRDGRLTALAD